jgi:hypothetical protein
MIFTQATELFKRLKWATNVARIRMKNAYNILEKKPQSSENNKSSFMCRFPRSRKNVTLN